MDTIIEITVCIVLMAAVTVLFQYFLYRTKKNVSFWSGYEIVFAGCILGLISGSINYFAIILGYVLGEYIGKFAGWHKTQN